MIQNALKEVIEDPGSDISPEVFFSEKLEYGDYFSSVALALAKSLKEDPLSVANKLKEKLSKIDNIEKVEVVAPGFINFFLSKEYVLKKLTEARDDEEFGKNKEYAGQKIMVEYTDPNPFKEFHIGHLMPNAIGESISRLLEFSGADVVRANYQGDVGLHVAKAIYGIEKLESEMPKEDDLRIIAEFLGRAYALGATAYGDSPEAKEEIEEINTKVFEKSDRKINELYDWGRKKSLEYFETLYQKLDTKFDYYFFESEVASRGALDVKEHLGKVFEESEGAVIFKGEDYGLHNRVFINSKGLPTYETKEIGLSLLKFEKEKLNQSVVITANEQNEYFKVVLKALSLIHPEIAEKTKHFGHGIMKLPTGKMSSRKGNVVTAESLISGVENLVKEKIKDREFNEKERTEVVGKIAISAIKYSILKQSIGKDISFDFEKSISFEGDSGPYLVYSYVRAKSVLAKAPKKKTKSITSDNVGELERTLVRFPEVVERATREYSPQQIVSYLVSIASLWNSFYASNKIIRSEEENYRLTIAKAVSVVMKNGLDLLGIRTVERM